jgi:hypothetical protein
VNEITSIEAIFTALAFGVHVRNYEKYGRESGIVVAITLWEGDRVTHCN